MNNTTARDIEPVMDFRQKLVNNLVERQKLVNQRKGTVLVAPQEVLIQRRHNRLSKEINQLHKQYANILD